MQSRIRNRRQAGRATVPPARTAAPAGRPGLPGFVRETFAATGSDGTRIEHDLFGAPRDGPTVIVIHEGLGLSRSTLAVADRVREAGLSPLLPLLAGEPLPGMVAGYRNFLTVCVRREFGALARNEGTPVADWLRSLAEDEHARSPGRKVGVIGMCFSGGFALAMALSPAVGATVSSQPAFPLAIPGRRANLGVNPGDIQELQVRTDGGRTVRTLRFQRDYLSPGVRCARLVEALPATDAVEIPSRNPFDHPVLARAVHAAEDSPLRRELDRTIEFLATRLSPATA